MAYLWLFAAFTLNSAANILIKLGADKGLSLSQNPLALVTSNWQFLAGLILFAANVLFYFLALRALPLSTAYPIMVAMSFFLINGYAYLSLHEPMNALQVGGYILMVVGLTLVVSQGS